VTQKLRAVLAACVSNVPGNLDRYLGAVNTTHDRQKDSFIAPEFLFGSDRPCRRPLGASWAVWVRSATFVSISTSRVGQFQPRRQRMPTAPQRDNRGEIRRRSRPEILEISASVGAFSALRVFLRTRRAEKAPSKNEGCRRARTPSAQESKDARR